MRTMRQNEALGKGRQPCKVCGMPSLRGLVRGGGLCVYHYAAIMFGQQWADQCYPELEDRK